MGDYWDQFEKGKGAAAPAAAPPDDDYWSKFESAPVVEEPVPTPMTTEQNVEILTRMGYKPDMSGFEPTIPKGVRGNFVGKFIGDIVDQAEGTRGARRAEFVRKQMNSVFTKRFPGYTDSTHYKQLTDMLDVAKARNFLNSMRENSGLSPNTIQRELGVTITEDERLQFLPNGKYGEKAGIRDRRYVFDIEDADQARAFLSTYENRAPNPEHPMWVSLLGSVANSLTFGVSVPDDLQEELAREGSAHKAQLGLLGEVAFAGADLAGALIPIGSIGNLLGRGMLRAGATEATAARLAGPLSMAIYGAPAGGVEGAAHGAAFGFLAPQIASRLRGRLAGMPPRLQNAAAEAIGFALVGQGLNPDGTWNDAKVNAIIGAMMGAASKGGVRATQDKIVERNSNRFRRKGILGERARRNAEFAEARERAPQRAAERATKEMEARQKSALPEQAEAGPIVPADPAPGVKPAARSRAVPVARDNILEGAPKRSFEPTKPVAESEPILRQLKAKVRKAEAAGKTENAVKARNELLTEMRKTRDPAAVDIAGVKTPAPVTAPRPGKVVPDTPQAKTPGAQKGVIGPRDVVSPQERVSLNDAMGKYGPAAKGPTKPLGPESGAADIATVAKLAAKGINQIPRAWIATALGRPELLLAGPADVMYRKAVGGIQTAARRLALQVPGAKRLAKAGADIKEARLALEMRQDGHGTGSLFEMAKVKAEYEQDATALEVNRSIAEKRKVRDPGTGRKRRLFRKEKEDGDLYSRGEIDKAEAKRRNVPKELIESIDRDSVEIGRMHNLLREMKVIGEQSHQQYKDGKYRRTEYAELLADELGTQLTGSDSVKMGKIRIKLDEPTLTWKEGGKDRFKKFSRKEFGSEEAAISARKKMAKQLRSEAAQETEVNKANAAFGKRGGKSRITTIREHEMVKRDDVIRHPAFTAARTMMLQQSLLAKNGLLADVAKNMGRKVKKGDVAPDGFKQIPNEVGYGPLRDMAVPKKLYKEIVGTYGEGGFANHWTGQFMDTFLSQWKVGKTIWNPATHSRNFLGNAAVFAPLAGISPVVPGDYVHFKNAAKVMMAKRGTPEYALLKALTRGGVGRNMGVSKDAMVMLGTIEGGEASSFMGWRKKAFAQLKKGKVMEAIPGFDSLRALYEIEDVIFKLAFGMKRIAKGDPLETAIAKTNRGFPNYNQNTLARFARSKNAAGLRATVAPPFLAFSAEMARIMSIHAVESPFKTMALYTMFSAVSQAAADQLGITDEDMNLLKKVAPDWAPPATAGSPLLPWTNENGKLQTLDLRYILLGADVFVGLQGLLNGKGPVGTNTSIVNHPLLAPLEDTLFNRQRFTGKDLLTDQDPDGFGDDSERILNYFMEAWAPSWTPGVGRSFKRFKEGITGEPITNAAGVPNQWGDTRSFLEAGLDTVFGLRTREINVERDRMFKHLSLQKKMREKVKGVRKRERKLGRERFETLYKAWNDKKATVRDTIWNKDEKDLLHLLNEMQAIRAEIHEIAKPPSERLQRFTGDDKKR
ncbi:MAG: hypothetical protein GY946_04975 [bacterium]|nr:hypothetical protein [bacterium]